MVPLSTLPTNTAPPVAFDATPMTPPLRPSLVLAMPSPMSVDSMLESPTGPLVLPAFLRDKPRGVKRSNNDWSTPSAPIQSTSDLRPIAPLKSKRASSAPGHSPVPLVSSLPMSREPSPAPETCSTPVKRARTSSISGDISNFHILPSSDDEMENPKASPSSRCRSRFNQLLGPSPLQRSFSSTAVPQHAQFVQPTLDRAITLPVGDGTIKTRAKALLSKVEKVEAEHVGTEMNKVFMLVHGRGMGMGSVSGGKHHRRGSALRPREFDEGMDLD